VRGGVYSKCGITQKIMKEEKAQRERERVKHVLLRTPLSEKNSSRE
jgi:hypothetical protein